VEAAEVAALLTMTSLLISLLLDVAHLGMTAAVGMVEIGQSYLESIKGIA
jgi:hypothetical protein